MMFSLDAKVIPNTNTNRNPNETKTQQQMECMLRVRKVLEGMGDRECERKREKCVVHMWFDMVVYSLFACNYSFHRNPVNNEAIKTMSREFEKIQQAHHIPYI